MYTRAREYIFTDGDLEFMVLVNKYFSFTSFSG